MAHVAYRQRGGEDAVFDNECDLLERGGVEVVRARFSNDDIDEQGVVRKLGLGLTTVWSSRGRGEIQALLRKEKPQVAHFHNTFPLLSPSVYWACRAERVPVVQTLHNFRLICPNGILYRDGAVCEECPDYGLQRSIRHACYRDSRLATAAVVAMLQTNRRIGSYQQVSAYIALTQFAAARFAAAGIPRERIRIKPNFLPDPTPAEFAVGAYGLYIGRISKEKGLATLVEALALIGSPALPLKVAGDGPERVSLQRLAESRGLPIEFCGFVEPEPLRRLLRRSAFLVVPSLCFEGFPMVLLEAFAAGKPVLASRLGGLDELVEDGHTGRKFRPGDAAELARLWTELSAGPAALEDMGRNARARFDRDYTDAANLRRLRSIYGELAA